jgi:hypothetical protein
LVENGVTPMSLQSKYRNILSGILPAGAVGASLLLGSAVSSSAKEEPAGLQPQSFEQTAVAERLAAIRGAVSDVARAESAKRLDPNLRLAWGNWWRNGGWGWGWRRPWYGGGWNNWRNWNNWPNFWRNW